ncbi:MAG: hypothetical protein WB565_00140 [Acidimicrobiales bacterium]
MTPTDLLAALTDHVGPWGPMATEQQWADARAILDLDGPRRHWIGRAKGYSKTRDAAALSIVSMLTQSPIGSDEMAYCLASDSEQSTLVRQSITAFVDGTPELKGEILVEGRKITAPRRGAQLHVLAADLAGSHGLRPWWLLCDELANWENTARNRELFDSLWAGLVKTGGRGVVITTAGSPAHFARGIFEAAKTDPMWRVSNLEGPPPWVDPAEVESERRRLPASVFGRLWTNVWSSADDSLADEEDVDAACVLKGVLEPQENRRYIATVDLGVKSDRTAVVIAHTETDENGRKIIVDRMQVWTPKLGRPVKIDHVRAWLAEFCRLYHAPLHYDPSQAYLLVEDLRKAEVSCHEFVFSTASVGKIASSLMQALRTRRILLPDDKELRHELLSVRLRETAPNVLRIDHLPGQHDDRAIATAMATWLLTSGPLPGRMLFDTEDKPGLDPLGRPIMPLVGGRFAGNVGFPSSLNGQPIRDDRPERPEGAGTTKPSPFA